MNPLSEQLQQMGSNACGLFLVHFFITDIDWVLIRSTMEAMTYCMNAVADENTTSKEILYQSIRRVFPDILQASRSFQQGNMSA